MNEDPKDLLNELEYGLDRLRDGIEQLIEDINTQKMEATEEAFAVLLENGFNVGVCFTCGDDKNAWKIVGIRSNGFVVERDGKDGKKVKTTLPADSKPRVEKFIKSLKIIREAEV